LGNKDLKFFVCLRALKKKSFQLPSSFANENREAAMASQVDMYNVQQSYPPGQSMQQPQLARAPTQQHPQLQAQQSFVLTTTQDDSSTSLAMTVGMLLVVVALFFMVLGAVVAFLLACGAFPYYLAVVLTFEMFVCLIPGMVCLYSAYTNIHATSGGGAHLLYLAIVGGVVGVLCIVCTVIAANVGIECPDIFGT
jgi:hypothetical protein